MIFVYVIKSKVHKFRYVGISSDIGRRLFEHNNGKNKSTKNYRPYDLILSEQYENYKVARAREKFLKSGQGRKVLDNI